MKRSACIVSPDLAAAERAVRTTAGGGRGPAEAGRAERGTWDGVTSPAAAREVRATARAWRLVATAGLVAAISGCAGATVGGGVGDAWLSAPPYYAGSQRRAVTTLAYQPVAYQAGASQTPIFDPRTGEGTEVSALLDAMNATLEAVAQRRGLHPVSPPPGQPPDVHFGCNDGAFPECRSAEDGNGPGAGETPMRLAVGRPSEEWARGAAQALGSTGADALLVLTLEVGQYWPRYTNWRGSKAVHLGTEHTISLPWLTSMDTPVQVLQLTGALVGPDGKAIRIGAEGMLARRTPLIISGLGGGGQALISDEDVSALMSARREDLPGRPLVWEVALHTLLDQLGVLG